MEREQRLRADLDRAIDRLNKSNKSLAEAEYQLERTSAELRRLGSEKKELV